MSTTEPWFVSERAEYIAGAFLTRRDDVSVKRHHRDGQRCYDFVVCTTPDEKNQAPVAIEVKGIRGSPTPQLLYRIKDWLRHASAIPMAAILLVVDVDGEKCLYTWVRRPDPFAIDHLQTVRFEEIELRRFTDSSLESVIRMTREHYAAKG